MIVFPVMSIVFTPAGVLTWPERPTAAMRLFSTRMSPRSITSSPFIVTMRAFLSSTLPRPCARGSSKPTVVVCGVGVEPPPMDTMSTRETFGPQLETSVLPPSSQ